MSSRYTRYNAPPPPPVLGWTPRTPAAPHAPPARPHARTPVPTPPAPRSGSPRLPAPPPSNVTPIAISPPVGAHTPSWLKGTYRPQPPVLSSSPTTVDQWCAERIDAIKATVDGKGEGLPELRRVMEVLDSAKVADEIAVISNIRKEYWKTRERQRKAVMELRRAEREVQRIGLPASQIESKINRLSRYARFIESGWQDGQLLDVSEGLDEKDGNAHVKQEPPHTKKEESLVKQEPPPATDCQIEDDVKEGR